MLRAFAGDRRRYYPAGESPGGTNESRRRFQHRDFREAATAFSDTSKDWRALSISGDACGAAPDTVAKAKSLNEAMKRAQQSISSACKDQDEHLKQFETAFVARFPWKPGVNCRNARNNAGAADRLLRTADKECWAAQSATLRTMDEVDRLAIRLQVGCNDGGAASSDESVYDEEEEAIHDCHSKCRDDHGQFDIGACDYCDDARKRKARSGK